MQDQGLECGETVGEDTQEDGGLREIEAVAAKGQKLQAPAASGRQAAHVMDAIVVEREIRQLRERLQPLCVCVCIYVCMFMSDLKTNQSTDTSSDGQRTDALDLIEG